MAEPRDPLAAFDPSLVAEVAAEEGVETEELRDLLRAHQETVRERPGVDDLVYEWRRTLPYDPLVARTDAAYHVALVTEVWEEFLAHLEFDARERRALVAVHERQARSAAAARGDDESVYDGAAPMVLTRT